MSSGWTSYHAGEADMSFTYIGYLLSDDPVAIDKASLDLVNQVKENIFLKVNKINPMKQITYAEQIGLGSSTYEFVAIT